MILLSYEFQMLEPFGDAAFNTVYLLTLEKKTWFGLRKKKVKARVSLPFYTNTKAQLEYWDNLIKTKQPFE